MLTVNKASQAHIAVNITTSQFQQYIVLLWQPLMKYQYKTTTTQYQLSRKVKTSKVFD